jgi:hypothetical protein
MMTGPQWRVCFWCNEEARHESRPMPEPVRLEPTRHYDDGTEYRCPVCGKCVVLVEGDPADVVRFFFMPDVLRSIKPGIGPLDLEGGPGTDNLK